MLTYVTSETRADSLLLDIVYHCYIIGTCFVIDHHLHWMEELPGLLLRFYLHGNPRTLQYTLAFLDGGRVAVNLCTADPFHIPVLWRVLRASISLSGTLDTLDFLLTLDE